MTNKYNLIIIFLIVLHFISPRFQTVYKSPPVKGINYPDIKCGKNEPKNSKDCIKYGTDSGMLCCWVSDSKESSNGRCTLLYSKVAENDFSIDGDTLFQSESESETSFNEYWDCGNKSFYLNTIIIKFFAFLIVIIL